MFFTALWIQTVHHVMCSILIGLSFFKTANDGSEMFNHLKLCVGLVIFFAYTQIMVPVLVCEYYNNFYQHPIVIRKNDWIMDFLCIKCYFLYIKCYLNNRISPITCIKFKSKSTHVLNVYNFELEALREA